MEGGDARRGHGEELTRSETPRLSLSQVVLVGETRADQMVDELLSYLYCTNTY